MEQLTVETISRHMKEKKIIRRIQHGITKGKSHLTNLISFYNEIPSLIDEGRAVDIVFLDFRTFDTVPYKIFIEKL